MNDTNTDEISKTHKGHLEKSLSALESMHPDAISRAPSALIEASEVISNDSNIVVTNTLQRMTESRPNAGYDHYGLALNLVVEKFGSPVYKITDDLLKVVEVFKKHGFLWGGERKYNKDLTMFYLTFGYTKRQLFDRERLYGSGEWVRL